MLITVTCPDTNQEVEYEITRINTAHLIKLISSGEKLGGKLVQFGNKFSMDKDNITGILMTLITGDLISFFATEGLDIVADIINKPVDYVRRLDPADVINLICGIIEETDFEKLGKAIKKLMEVGVIKLKLPTNK